MISHNYAMMYSSLGRMGIVVVMLLTSILLLGFGLLAIRLRKVLMGSVTEATGSIIQRFTAPSTSGGGSSSTSVSTGGAGGDGGSGGGAIGGAASSALSSTASGAGSMIGRGVGAAVLGGGSVAAGMRLLNGKGSEHSSVATGDGDSYGDTSVANAQAGDVNANVDGNGTSSNTANANLNNTQSNASAMGADGIATSAAIMSGAMADGAAVDRSERDAGMALMESDSLASATSSESSMRNAQAGEAGPAHSNYSMQDAIANSNATSGDMRGVNADATGIGANGTNGVGIGGVAGVNGADANAMANGYGYGTDTGTGAAGVNGDMRNVQSGAANNTASEMSYADAIRNGAITADMDADATANGSNANAMANGYGYGTGSASANGDIRGVQGGAANTMTARVSYEDAMRNGAITADMNANVTANGYGTQGANGANANAMANGYGYGAGAAGANGNGVESRNDIRGVGADTSGANANAAGYGAGYGADGQSADIRGVSANATGVGAGYGASGANGYGSGAANATGYGAAGANGYGVGAAGAAGQSGRGVSMGGVAADARAMSAQNVNANANAQGRMNAYRQGSVGVENRNVAVGRNGANGMAGGNGYGGMGQAGANGANGGMAGSYRVVGGSVNVNGMGGANGMNGVGSVGATGRGVAGMNGGNGMVGRSGMSGAAGRNGAAGMAGIAGRNGSAGMNGAGGYRVNNTQNSQTNIAGSRYAMPSTPNISVTRGGNASQRGYMPPRNANRQMPNPMNSLPNEDIMPTGPARGVGSINPIRTNAGGQIGGRGSYGRMQQQQGAYKNTAGTNDFV